MKWIRLRDEKKKRQAGEAASLSGIREAHHNVRLPQPCSGSDGSRQNHIGGGNNGGGASKRAFFSLERIDSKKK